MAEISAYAEIAEVISIQGKNLFPISWLHKQEYCEYQIYLENVKRVKVQPNQEMRIGKKEHEQLYKEFKKESVPTTLAEILSESKTRTQRSREFPVRDIQHGVYGRIDELLLTPQQFLVVDDKPGIKIYKSNINQVYGYCLALKEIIGPVDDRRIVAALRERGTNNIHWEAPFSKLAEEEIIPIISHIHAAIAGSEDFASSDNPNKCKACRFSMNCERALAA